MKKNIAMSIGCLLMAGMLGCAYDPDYSSCELGYPVQESQQYALAPNARWTCLHYHDGGPWGPFLDMRIFPDSHRIQFTRAEFKKKSPTVNHDRVATADEWAWIAGQLEKADVSHWKTSYVPGGGVMIFDGTTWHLEFLDGTNVVGNVDGYNAWPKNFKAFQSILNAFDASPAVNSTRSSYIHYGNGADPIGVIKLVE